MTGHRDVGAFDRRARSYEQGWLGRWHAVVAGRTSAIAAAALPSARTVLDVGCGTGTLLRLLAAQLSSASELIGIDPAPRMIETARDHSDDPRLRFMVGTAEALPQPDQTIELVVTTTSFDHWCDQPAGLRECRRVLCPGGRLVLADLITPMLWPTTVIGRRGKARTPRRVHETLIDAGFRVHDWQTIATMIRAVTAEPATWPTGEAPGV